MAASMLVQPVMSRTGWEHFPHKADVGVRGFGATPAEAFEQGALALTAVVTHARVEPLVEVEVSCQAPDVELLFADWLNTIIYEMAVRKMLFARFAVTIEGYRIEILWAVLGAVLLLLVLSLFRRSSYRRPLL